MIKIITGGFLSLCAVCFIVFKIQVATLLLGGPSHNSRTTWIEDQNVLFKISNYVEAAAWLALLVGLVLLGLGILQKQGRLPQKAESWR
jgi:hypothetical protein